MTTTSRVTRPAKITFELTEFRHWDDPVFKGLKTYVGHVRVIDMPVGCNLDPNVRLQYTKNRVFREMKRAMRNEDPRGKDAAHLGCLGIFFITTAAEVRMEGDRGFLTVKNRGLFCGILNGGHVYLACTMTREELLQLMEKGEDVINNQMIPIKVHAGSPRALKTYMAGALNCTVQTQEPDLMNSDGLFEGIKNQLDLDGIGEFFGARGNETKVVQAKVYTVYGCLRMMECFLVSKYPDGSGSHPSGRWANPGSLAGLFKNNPGRYAQVLHLLRDFWEIYETVWIDAYGASKTRTKAAEISFVEEKTNDSTPWVFPVVKRESKTRLTEAAAAAMAASFRCYLRLDPNTDTYVWDRPFEHILEEVSGLLKMLFKKTKDYVGKEKASDKCKQKQLWDVLYGTVDNHRLKGLVQ